MTDNIEHVKPFVYAVLANDKSNELNLKTEYENFENRFLPYANREDVVEGRIRMFSKNGTIIRGFEQAINEMSIFYFAGHANAERIQLEDGPFNVRKLSLFLNRDASPNLRLVFLNACHTHSLVEELLASGVPLIIASKKAVDDKIALMVADYFWELLLTLKIGEDLGSIIKALDRFMQLLEIEGVNGIRVRRGLVPEEDDKTPTYGIYYNEDTAIAKLAKEWIPIPNSPKSNSKAQNSNKDKAQKKRAKASHERIKESIANGHFEEAIELLRELAKDSYYENDTIGLQGRFNGLQRQRNSNTIRTGDYERGLAQIRESIFYILKKL